MSFAFELGARVQIIESAEAGTIEGRCEYLPIHGENTYWLAYQAADGRATTGWWGESKIEAQP